MPDQMIQAVKELAHLPMGDFIRSVALGIADAQFQLDKASMTVAEFMSGTRMNRDLDSGKLLDAHGNDTNEPLMVDSRVYFGYHFEDGKKVADKLSMFELGFTPTFYQFVDTAIEMKVAVRMSRAERSGDPRAASGNAPDTSAWWSGGSAEHRLHTTPVDAHYASSYNFKGEFVSSVKTKLVPIPPPTVLEERLRLLLSQERSGPEDSGDEPGDDTSAPSGPPDSFERYEAGTGVHKWRFYGQDGRVVLTSRDYKTAGSLGLGLKAAVLAASDSERWHIVPREGTFRVLLDRKGGGSQTHSDSLAESPAFQSHEEATRTRDHLISAIPKQAQTLGFGAK